MSRCLSSITLAVAQQDEWKTFLFKAAGNLYYPQLHDCHAGSGYCKSLLLLYQRRVWADFVLQFGLGMWSSGQALHDGSGGKVFSCEDNWHPVSWVAGGI